MNKKIVYIAGKITDEPKFKTKFKRAERHLKELGYIVLNPARLPEGLKYEQYMNICFAMLDESDIIYLLENVEDSPGALRELERSIERGKLVACGGIVITDE